MTAQQGELCQGKKTFFVVPEVSLFPEEYTKSFFLRGFETYFIDDDPYCPLDRKIHALFSLFPEVLLFFNVDRPIRGIDWPSFIGSLQRTYKDRALIGVMYRKRNTAEVSRELERLYLYDIGINAGCIPIEYQKSRNLNLFLNVLIANQASGQRRHLRALCDDSYKMNFLYRGKQYQCALRDISISHFSCVFAGAIPEIPLLERIDDIQMNLRGTLLNVRGVYTLKRLVNGILVHVFVFRCSEERDGLRPEHVLKVNGIIHSFFQANMTAILRDAFDAIRAHSAKERLSVGVAVP